MRRSHVVVPVGVGVACAVTGLLVGWFIFGKDDADDSETVGRRGVIVFVSRDITDDQRADLESALREDPRVADIHCLDEEESLAEFERLFEDNEEMLERAHENPDLIPTSCRATAVDCSTQTLQGLQRDYAEFAGVIRTTTPVDCEPAGD